MSARDALRRELETVLRARGVPARDLSDILSALHSSCRQFPLESDESKLDEFVTLFKKVVYFSVFAHAPTASTQVASQFDAREWAQRHARMYFGAPAEASFG